MNKNALTIVMLSLTSITMLSGIILASSKVSADNDSVTDEISITVPVACTMGGSIATGNEHTATLLPGTYSGTSGSDYENGIGKTTLTVFCNDYNGFSIYAVGYTGDSMDNENHTKLVGTSASGNATIPTKVYESTDTTSNWSMKVEKITDTASSYNPSNMTITGSFNSWHTVPDTYTKVAEYHATAGSSATDTTLGAKVETTYAAYISSTQPADTYTGKVKYVMVHPYNAEAPKIPMSSCPTSPMISTIASGITYMQDINSSNKATILSALTTDNTYQIIDNRDNETYCVGKLADGKLWLLDNLTLDLTNSTVLSGMNENNTNASNTTLGYLKNGGGTTSDRYAISGVVNWTDSPTYSSSNSYSDPLVNLTDKETIPTDTISTNGQYKVGGYYNYCAASAGSYCYGNGASEGASSGNAEEDICPKGWRMSTGGSSGEYKTLYDNTSYNTYTNYRSALHLSLSGVFVRGSSFDQGSRGYLWSSTRGDNAHMYNLRLLVANNIYPTDVNNRYYGYSVRCLAE